MADGEPISFGGIEITPVLIPGHTPGALGFVFRVADGERSHTAALFGGSILLVNRIPTTVCGNTCNRSSASAP